MNAFTHPPQINWAKMKQARVTTDTSLKTTRIKIYDKEDPNISSAKAVLAQSQFELRDKINRRYR